MMFCLKPLIDYSACIALSYVQMVKKQDGTVEFINSKIRQTYCFAIFLMTAAALFYLPFFDSSTNIKVLFGFCCIKKLTVFIILAKQSLFNGTVLLKLLDVLEKVDSLTANDCKNQEKKTLYFLIGQQVFLIFWIIIDMAFSYQHGHGPLIWIFKFVGFNQQIYACFGFFVYIVLVINIRMRKLSEFLEHEVKIQNEDLIVKSTEESNINDDSTDIILSEDFFKSEFSAMKYFPKQPLINKFSKAMPVMTIVEEVVNCIQFLEYNINVALLFICLCLELDLILPALNFYRFFITVEGDPAKDSIGSPLPLTFQIREVLFSIGIFTTLTEACQQLIDSFTRLKASLVEAAESDSRIWSRVTSFKIPKFTIMKITSIGRAFLFQVILTIFTICLISRQIQHDRTKQGP